MAELLQTMTGFFQRIWIWLARDSNRGRVTTIAVVASAIIAAITFVAVLLTPASEVRMSVSEFQHALQRRAEEVRSDLATAHGEDRIRLENENAEIARQLADVQAAYVDRQERIGELEASLARLSTDVDDDELADARTALAAGDLSKADLLLAALEARADASVARAAEVAFQRGQIAASQIRWGDAAVHFDKAARLAPLYDHLRQAGTYAWRSGRYASALRHFRDLLDVSRREFGMGSPRTRTALGNLGSLLVGMGRHGEAEPLFRQALEIDRQTPGERHPGYAVRLCRLANVLAATGRRDEAEPLFRQALEIARATLGERRAAYANCLSNLAVLLAATGRNEEAERLYRQALEIGRQALGERHPDYAVRLNNLAVFLKARGRHGDAEPLHRQAVEIRRTTLGGEHPSYADSLSNLAVLLAATGRHEEAERLYRQALEIGRATPGERHPGYAGSLNNLAALLADTGRHGEAERLLRQALQVDRQALGERHPDYATWLHNLAIVLESTGRHDEAEPLFRQAVDVLRATLGDEDASTRRIAGNFAGFLRARSPGSPALIQLQAAFGDDIGVP